MKNTPTLETKRLLLRKFTWEDRADFYAMMCDREMNTYLPWYPPQSRQQAEEMLQEKFLIVYNKPLAYRYAICLKGEGRPIGYVCLGEADSYDFGYGLLSKYWHRGIATEAARAVVARIARSGIPYITATHDVNNPRSGQVMTKLGMRYGYSYIECWQPKNLLVTFRMYQLNFDGSDQFYKGYWNRYPQHFVEEDL